MSSCSRVVLLRSEISTFCRLWSSSAWPENVIGLPGATTMGCVDVGGFISTGALMFTDGGIAVELTTAPISEAIEGALAIVRPSAAAKSSGA